MSGKILKSRSVPLLNKMIQLKLRLESLPNDAINFTESESWSGADEIDNNFPVADMRIAIPIENEDSAFLESDFVEFIVEESFKEFVNLIRTNENVRSSFYMKPSRVREILGIK